MSVHGAAISQTWYPVMEKPLYRLQNGALHPQNLLSKSQSMKHVTQQSTTTDITTDRKNSRRTISPTLFVNTTLENADVGVHMDMIHNITKQDVLKTNDYSVVTMEDDEMVDDELENNINDNAYFASLLKPKKKSNKSLSSRNVIFYNTATITSALSKAGNNGKGLNLPGGYVTSSRLTNGGRNQLMLMNQTTSNPTRKTSSKMFDKRLIHRTVNDSSKILQSINDKNKKSQATAENIIDDSSVNSKTTEGIQNIIHNYHSSISVNE